MIRGFLIVLCLLTLAGGASAQSPGMFHVLLPNGGSFVETDAPSGTLSSGGITCVWSSGTNSATFTLIGNYTTSWMHPSVDLAWFSTSAELPMVVTVTEPGTGTYDFAAPVNTGTWDTSIDMNGLSGDWSYSHVFPVASRFDLDFGLNDQGTDYDMSVLIEWGEGVADTPDCWAGVKALYR